MYSHRHYSEKSDNINEMASLVSRLNSLGVRDWLTGRMYSWKYGRWSERSRDDAQFERQAELFTDGSGCLRGIIVTENFGEDYYLLSERDERLVQRMLDYIKNEEPFHDSCNVIALENDAALTGALKANGFTARGDADIMYTYPRDKLALPQIELPKGYTLTDQQHFTDMHAVELQRFRAFNPDAEYTDAVDGAYKYGRSNPFLKPSLNIVLLNDEGQPISSCMGHWDEVSRILEVEVVCTLKEYENRGFAKLVIAECIRRGVGLGAAEVVISSWSQKTRRLYSSFGEAAGVQKIKYAI